MTKKNLKKRVISKADQLWSAKLILVEHAMPLIRILLILRKFRVGIKSMKVDQIDQKYWQADFVLDFCKSNRIDTVFKKIARLYDVAKLRYQKGRKLNSQAIIFK